MAGMSVSRTVLLIAAAVAVVVGAVFGAWVDWTWWNPVYGIQIVVILGAAVVVIIALAAGLVARRLRPVALVAVAAVVGLGGGLGLGPSREPVQGGTGTLTLRLDGDDAAPTTWIASCSTVQSGRPFAVRTSESQAVGVPGAWQALPSISVGDMWRDGNQERADGIGISLLLVSGGAVTDKTGPAELLLGSAAASRIEATSLSPQSGSIRFAGLVPDPRRSAPPQVPPAIAGTISWTCGA
jgi:hypothetical protein